VDATNHGPVVRRWSPLALGACFFLIVVCASGGGLIVERYEAADPVAEYWDPLIRVVPILGLGIALSVVLALDGRVNLVLSAVFACCFAIFGGSIFVAFGWGLSVLSGAGRLTVGDLLNVVYASTLLAIIPSVVGTLVGVLLISAVAVVRGRSLRDRSVGRRP